MTKEILKANNIFVDGAGNSEFTSHLILYYSSDIRANPSKGGDAKLRV